MRTLLSFAMVLATWPLAPAAAQTASPARCAALAKQWDAIEKEMAANATGGIADNSVPRATLRKLEDLESLAKADLIYQMMRDNKCPLPEAPPSAATYLVPALQCSNESFRQRSSDIPECKRDTWTKLGS